MLPVKLSLFWNKPSLEMLLRLFQHGLCTGWFCCPRWRHSLKYVKDIVIVFEMAQKCLSIVDKIAYNEFPAAIATSYQVFIYAGTIFHLLFLSLYFNSNTLRTYNLLQSREMKSTTLAYHDGRWLWTDSVRHMFAGRVERNFPRQNRS